MEFINQDNFLSYIKLCITFSYARFFRDILQNISVYINYIIFPSTHLLRDILREIQRLRIEQEAHAKASPDPHQPRNPTLLAELRLLRQRRDELEGRMSALQESRRELMVQLEGLMKLLKVGKSLWFIVVVSWM